MKRVWGSYFGRETAGPGDNQNQPERTKYTKAKVVFRDLPLPEGAQGHFSEPQERA